MLRLHVKFEQTHRWTDGRTDRRNEQFLLFPPVFSTHLENFLPSSSNLKLSSAYSFSLEESRICRLGKG